MKSPVKKAKEGMQESGKDKFVNTKKLQTNTLPNGTRQDKEPMDTPLEVDQLSYSKKDKAFQGPEKILAPITHDSNMANKKSKINQLEESWKENKKEKDKSDYERGNF
jgi:hypothetical protein